MNIPVKVKWEVYRVGFILKLKGTVTIKESLNKDTYYKTLLTLTVTMIEYAQKSKGVLIPLDDINISGAKDEIIAFFAILFPNEDGIQGFLDQCDVLF